MTDPIHIEGFDESGPWQADAETGRHQADRLADNARQERRAIGNLTDTRLFALKGHVEDLHRIVGGLKGQVTTIETDQKKNNEMTSQILTIISGGKLLVTLIKFFGVLAVPITALYTLWYFVTHGGPPPGH